MILRCATGEFYKITGLRGTFMNAIQLFPQQIHNTIIFNNNYTLYGCIERVRVYVRAHVYLYECAWVDPNRMSVWLRVSDDFH
jgi:hypothetical protein